MYPWACLGRFLWGGAGLIQMPTFLKYLVTSGLSGPKVRVEPISLVFRVYGRPSRPAAELKDICKLQLFLQS